MSIKNVTYEFRRKVLKPVEKLDLELPWPPTVNMYWRHVGHRVLISGRDAITHAGPNRLPEAKRAHELRDEILIQSRG